MENEIIQSLIKQFNYYKTVGDKTFNQLTFDELNLQLHQESNTISTIVKHMVGNMLSRWTNFLTEDGEKTWRQRELEFEPTYQSKEELINAWGSGWKCLFDAITPLSNQDMDRIIYIRNEGHLVSEAIFRQLGHYSYHIGQIAYIGKLIKGKDWKSLSIAKGQSESYNAKKFNQEKGRRHFTDDL